jgi:hypothetical protein
VQKIACPGNFAEVVAGFVPDAGSMVDTVKMKRLTRRRQTGAPGGRVEHDALGNAVWTRSRASDSEEPPDTSALSIVEDPPVVLDDHATADARKSADPSLKRTGK